MWSFSELKLNILHLNAINRKKWKMHEYIVHVFLFLHLLLAYNYQILIRKSDLELYN